MTKEKRQLLHSHTPSTYKRLTQNDSELCRQVSGVAWWRGCGWQVETTRMEKRLRTGKRCRQQIHTTNTYTHTHTHRSDQGNYRTRVTIQQPADFSSNTQQPMNTATVHDGTSAGQQHTLNLQSAPCLSQLIRNAWTHTHTHTHTFLCALCASRVCSEFDEAGWFSQQIISMKKGIPISMPEFCGSHIWETFFQTLINFHLWCCVYEEGLDGLGTISRPPASSAKPEHLLRSCFKEKKILALKWIHVILPHHENTYE